MSNAEEAKHALDYILFSDIYNAPELRNWEFTFEDDKYVLLHVPTSELFHFKVMIQRYEWDSAKARANQGWPV